MKHIKRVMLKHAEILQGKTLIDQDDNIIVSLKPKNE